MCRACALHFSGRAFPGKSVKIPWCFMTLFKPVDLHGVRTRSLKGRKSLMARDKMGTVCNTLSVKDFVQSLPDILAARDFKEVVQRLSVARKNNKVILWGIGAHVIKVGLSLILIDLMDRGFVTALALNGAGVIHDVEMAMLGQTSEDVATELDSGDFGMAAEPAIFINSSVAHGVACGKGLGESVGGALLESGFPHIQESLLAAATARGIPVTVHVAIGTDIIHMHPSCNGAAHGEASHRDFRLLTAIVGQLEGGVYLNIGSAVVLPEAFLKAVNLARNLGNSITHFTTVTLDFLRHYRPLTNVVSRPVAKGGKGFFLTGHHEIMIPLLAAALKEEDLDGT